jgi:flavin reductase (DIM6/NTAB) family NADH-FMN oxidoreductase RutF
MTVDPTLQKTAKVHSLLLGAINPRPIAFASTVNEEGKPNLAPFSFFNVFSANPPILIFSPARRGRDNTTKHTFENVKKVGEVVINIVNYNMIQQMSLASCEFPEGVNEFEKSGLTALSSNKIKPFRVKESPAQFECIVKDIIELGQEGGAGNLIICEVIMMHFHDDIMSEDGTIDQKKIDTVARMGGDWYCRANGNAIFEVAKPNVKLGIGVDSIPTEIRNSRVLTGNNLGQLGNIERLPSETDVNDYRLTELSDLFITFESDANKLEHALHQHAKSLLENGDIENAWKVLLSFNN